VLISKHDIVFVGAILLLTLYLYFSPTEKIPQWQHEREQQQQERSGQGRF
jgi:hypothetical protein